MGKAWVARFLKWSKRSAHVKTTARTGAVRPAAIEWQLAINHRRHAVADDLDVRRAHRDRIDPHQHLGRPWLRHRLLDESKLLRAAQHPGLHPVGDRVLVAAGRRVGARCGHVTGPMP